MANGEKLYCSVRLHLCTGSFTIEDLQRLCSHFYLVDSLDALDALDALNARGEAMVSKKRDSGR